MDIEEATVIALIVCALLFVIGVTLIVSGAVNNAWLPTISGVVFVVGSIATAAAVLTPVRSDLPSRKDA